VAAWMRAETGVGPSIASVSQTCKPNCADLPTAANMRHKQRQAFRLIFALEAAER
jgi:hypothetical protein